MRGIKMIYRKTFTIKLEPELIERIKEIADKEGVYPSRVVERFLNQVVPTNV